MAKFNSFGKTTVDSELNSESTNALQNKIIKEELDKKVSKSGDIMTGSLTMHNGANIYAQFDSDLCVGVVNTELENKTYSGITFGLDYQRTASTGYRYSIYLDEPTNTYYFGHPLRSTVIVSSTSYDLYHKNGDDGQEYMILDEGNYSVKIPEATTSQTGLMTSNQVTQLNNAVQKVSGKGLSTNDLTDAMVTKIDNIPEALSVKTYTLTSSSNYTFASFSGKLYKYGNICCLNLYFSTTNNGLGDASQAIITAIPDDCTPMNSDFHLQVANYNWQELLFGYVRGTELTIIGYPKNNTSTTRVCGTWITSK